MIVHCSGLWDALEVSPETLRRIGLTNAVFRVEHEENGGIPFQQEVSESWRHRVEVPLFLDSSKVELGTVKSGQSARVVELRFSDEPPKVADLKRALR